MPLPDQYKALSKTNRRQQWKDLKNKHSKLIAKAKVDFDLKFGPTLDKYQVQVDLFNKQIAGHDVTPALVQPVLAAATAVKKIADSYRDKLKTVEDPAKKDMTAFLTALEADRHSWEKLADSTKGAVPQPVSLAQQRAALELVKPLDQVRATTLTIVTHGQRAKQAYEKAVPARKGAAALVGSLVTAASLTSPAAHELTLVASHVAGGRNYELLKHRASATAVQLQHLREAAKAFETHWDSDSNPSTLLQNADVIALHEGYDKLVAELDEALEHIHKL